MVGKGYFFHKNTMRTLITLLFISMSFWLNAAVVSVGSGSYTTTFPGTDAAGRNQFPPGTPQLSGTASGKPVPTNDWWSNLLVSDHVSNLFPHPLALRTNNQGLVLTYIPRGVMDAVEPIVIGVSGLNASRCTVDDYSDWTVTMAWNDGTHSLKATAGQGMPFVYFEKGQNNAVQIRINTGTAHVENEIVWIENARNGASFAIYAPTGSVWEQEGGTYTSTLNGKNYFSAAILPLENKKSIREIALDYQDFAYVFPQNTQTNFSYDEQTSVVTTRFEVETLVREGSHDQILLGLFPHQWAHLATTNDMAEIATYPSVRGTIKTLATNTFTVENTFKGILPTLPYVDETSNGFSATTLTQKIDAIKNDRIDDWTDSYNDGQLLNRLIQTGRIAAESGNQDALNTILNTVQQRVENWLSYQAGEVAFLFYYNNDWTALLGYPAGHGQDSNLNDHHFHWGYFIHAAAFLEQYKPGWAAQWGDMVNLLVRDAASPDRNDPLFPYLRNFSPYAGHCWANGFATFPQGNDQESTSESMQFNSSLIHWGCVTGNDAIRDLGIYLYTTEQTAIEEYWFDVYERNFPDTQQYALISRLWGNDLDNQTFWTGDIAASYGIELYPIHGGSLYLGHNLAYATKLWEEIKANTGIMRNEANTNLWHDVIWQFAAFIDPTEAIALYDSYPQRSLKFGISDPQTYHWLHAMNALGKVETNVTADYPIAAVFNKGGRKTYVAHNYTNETLTVHFSDGESLTVQPRSMGFSTRGEMLPEVFISSPAANQTIRPQQTITIKAEAHDYGGNTITQVDFIVDNVLIATDRDAPYTAEWRNNGEGTYQLSARATNSAGQTAISESIQITVASTATGESGGCDWTSSDAQQGSFSEGYEIAFRTEGNSVKVKSRLLDQDKTDVMAYVWKETPFTEYPMTREGDYFTATINDTEIGTTINLACKFAFAGGMSVTKYYSYTVGNNCEETTNLTSGIYKKLRIFPNPASDQLHIEAGTPIAKVVLHNLYGQQVNAVQVNASRCILDISTLPKGSYLLSVEYENGQWDSSKIIK